MRNVHLTFLLVFVLIAQIASLTWLYQYAEAPSEIVSQYSKQQEAQLRNIIHSMDGLKTALKQANEIDHRTRVAGDLLSEGNPTSFDFEKLSQIITASLDSELRSFAQEFRSQFGQHTWEDRGHRQAGTQGLEDDTLDANVNDSGEQSAIVANAHAVIDRALSAGAWSPSDAIELIEMGAARLDKTDHRELLEKIGHAINSQQLRIDDPAALLF